MATHHTLDGNPVYSMDPYEPPMPLEQAVAEKLKLKVAYDAGTNSYRFWDENTGQQYTVPVYDAKGYDKQYIMDSFVKLKAAVDKDRAGGTRPVNNLEEFMKIKDARVFTKEEVETLKASLTSLKKRLDLAAEAVRSADERAKDAETLVDDYKVLAEEKVKENEKLIKQVQSMEDLIKDQSQTIETLTDQIIEMQG